MTDKEKLSAVRAEIERRYRECNGATPATDYQVLLDLIDSMQEEPVGELEEAAYQSGYAAYPVDMAEEFGGVIRDNNRYQRSSYTKGFKEGANWQKQQMIKDAISAKVTEIYYPTDSCLEIEATLPEDRFEDGDKVLIIKE